MAFTHAKAEVCDMCGSREVDWVDPATGRLVSHPHLVPLGITCHGCREIESYRKSALDGENKPGVRVILVPDKIVDLEGKLMRSTENS